MPAVFLVSDTHFGHGNTCTLFKRNDGSPLRPFASAEEMDEHMVQVWNDRVRPNDKIYHLGDVVIKRQSLRILERLNGDKVLIKGNHDIFKLSDYKKYFRDIRAYHVMNGMILSHVPIHPESLARFGTNIHGHLHANRIMLNEQIDVRYQNVSVEQLSDYGPILFEDLQRKILNEGGSIGFKNKG